MLTWESYVSPGSGQQCLKVTDQERRSSIVYCTADWSSPAFAQTVRLLEIACEQRALDVVAKFVATFGPRVSPPKLSRRHART